MSTETDQDDETTRRIKEILSVAIDTRAPYAQKMIAALLDVHNAALLRLSSRVKELEGGLKKLTFAARTSGGVAGRDDELCAACEIAENLLGDFA